MAANRRNAKSKLITSKQAIKKIYDCYEIIERINDCENEPEIMHLFKNMSYVDFCKLRAAIKDTREIINKEIKLDVFSNYDYFELEEL